MKITTAQIQDRIQDAVSHDVGFMVLEDVLFALTTDPEIMAELNRRFQDWNREMNETHTEK